MRLNISSISKPILLTIFLLTGIFWTANRFYQTHYAAALQVIGSSQDKNMFADVKDGRADEWGTYLPKLRQAVGNDFSKHSDLAPYFELNEWFINLPSYDVSIFFVPNHISFFSLPPSYALSFQNFWYAALLLFATYWLCRNLAVTSWISAYFSVAVLFSKFVQSWWTSNFPLIGAILLPFAVLTSALDEKYKYPLLFWAIGHLVFGQLYPPFCIAAFYGVIPIVLAVKPELLRLRTVLLSTICVLAVGLIYYFNQYEYVQAVQATSYPGTRMSLGGDLGINSLMPLVLPNFPMYSGLEENFLETNRSMIWTLLPLLVFANIFNICLTKVSMRVILAMSFTFLFVGCFAYIGFNREFATASGLFLMPADRSSLTFSLALNLGSAVILSNQRNQILTGRSIVGLSALLFIGIASSTQSNVHTNFPDALAALFWPTIALGGIYLIRRLIDGRLIKASAFSVTSLPVSRILIVTMIAAGFGHIYAFGRFNPIIDAQKIFENADTQLLRDWEALYEYNRNEPFGTIGSYGHILRGYNLPSMSAVELGNVPIERFKEVFPYLTDAQINSYFNRFTGIEFDNIAEPEARGATVFFPVERHAPPFPHLISSNLSIATLITSPIARVRLLGQNQFEVRWESWMDQGGQIEKLINLSVPCSVANSFVTRYPIGGTIDDPFLEVELRGLAVRLTLNVSSENEAVECASGVRMSFIPPQSK